MTAQERHPRKKKLLTYTAFFEPDDDGGYVVTVPILPGCVTQGETFEEAKKMAKDAIRLYLKVLREDGVGTLRNIIRQSGLSLAEFLALV